MEFGQLGRRVGGRLDGGRQLVATGPVIRTGEMVAEYLKHYDSAALLPVNEAHEKVAKKSFY